MSVGRLIAIVFIFIGATIITLAVMMQITCMWTGPTFFARKKRTAPRKRF